MLQKVFQIKKQKKVINQGSRATMFQQCLCKLISKKESHQTSHIPVAVICHIKVPKIHVFVACKTKQKT
jgi:hypothetical protein